MPRLVEVRAQKPPRFCRAGLIQLNEGSAPVEVTTPGASARDAHLDMRGIDLGLGAQKRLLGLFEFRKRRPVARQKLLLVAEGQA